MSLAAINDLLPEFEDLLASARSCPNLRIIITLYYTSVSRGLIVRPFSAMPTAVTLVHQAPPSPRAARISGTTQSIPRHRGLAPPAYTPSPLRKNFAASPDPASSTAALLSPVEQHLSQTGMDSKAGLAAPSQFVISSVDDNDEGSDSGPDDSDSEEAEVVTNTAFAKQAFVHWKEGEDPFSDAFAPPPPSPSTKPSLRKRSPALNVEVDVQSLPYLTNDTSASPPIELKPGRPDFNQLLQMVIEYEQAFVRVNATHFDEKFAALNGIPRETEASLAGAGRIAVGACGPAGMVANLRSICFDADGVEFHAE